VVSTHAYFDMLLLTPFTESSQRGHQDSGISLPQSRLVRSYCPSTCRSYGYFSCTSHMTSNCCRHTLSKKHYVDDDHMIDPLSSLKQLHDKVWAYQRSALGTRTGANGAPDLFKQGERSEAMTGAQGREGGGIFDFGGGLTNSLCQCNSSKNPIWSKRDILKNVVNVTA